jgi:hypothetical protein
MGKWVGATEDVCVRRTSKTCAQDYLVDKTVTCKAGFQASHLGYLNFVLKMFCFRWLSLCLSVGLSGQNAS